MSVQETAATRYAWLNVKQSIKDDIDARKYKPGARVPSVAALAKKYEVSVSTVRQAIDELAAEGFLEVHQGKGTTVAPPKREYDPLMGFMEQAEQLGGKPKTQVTETGWTAPHRDTIRALGLRKGSNVWMVTRLHYLDDLPVIVEYSEFRKEIAPKFMDELKKLDSIFRTLEDLGYNELEVEVAAVETTSDRSFSDLLGIPRRINFFIFERRVYSNAKPLLVSYLVLRSDKFKARFGARVMHKRLQENNVADTS